MIHKIQIHFKNNIMIEKLLQTNSRDIHSGNGGSGWILLCMLYAGVLHRNGRTYKWNIELNLHLQARVGRHASQISMWRIIAKKKKNESQKDLA